MFWHIRQEGTPHASRVLSHAAIVTGLQEGMWQPSDEVRGLTETQWTPLAEHPAFAEVVAELTMWPTRPAEDDTRVDMNALIDVALVLLIFFILATTHAAAVHRLIHLPSTAPDTKKGTIPLKLEQVHKHMVRVTAFLDARRQPQIQIENQLVPDVWRADQTLDVDKLTAALRSHVHGAAPKRELLLDAHGVSWGVVVTIQDAAQAAGLRAVHYLQRGP